MLLQDFIAGNLSNPNHFWILLGCCSVLVGMSKTGVEGVYLLVVPLMALVAGGKDSTGLLLPILILSDLFAISYYRRTVNWKLVWPLYAWALLGVVLGTWVGNMVSEERFNHLIGLMILLGLGLLIWLESRKSDAVPSYAWFGAVMGILGGFTTMVGNMAGPVIAVYLLSMRLDKNNFIGSRAFFFFFINLSKVPFHVFVWKTIQLDTLLMDLYMLPAIALGAIAGIWIVKKIPDRYYRPFVMVATVLSALLLFLG